MKRNSFQPFWGKKLQHAVFVMWKLSFLKYGNTHLISNLYSKIGRWFILLEISESSLLQVLVNFEGSFTHIRKIKFLLTKWAFCFALTTSHIQPSFYIQGYLTTWSENGSWLAFSQAKSTFSNIWFPTATFNAGNCSTLGNQSIHPVAYFLQIILKKRT